VIILVQRAIEEVKILRGHRKITIFHVKAALSLWAVFQAMQPWLSQLLRVRNTIKMFLSMFVPMTIAIIHFT